jgi:hypothetical protein
VSELAPLVVLAGIVMLCTRLVANGMGGVALFGIAGFSRGSSPSRTPAYGPAAPGIAGSSSRRRAYRWVWHGVVPEAESRACRSSCDRLAGTSARRTVRGSWKGRDQRPRPGPTGGRDLNSAQAEGYVTRVGLLTIPMFCLEREPAGSKAVRGRLRRRAPLVPAVTRFPRDCRVRLKGRTTGPAGIEWECPVAPPAPNGGTPRP